MQRWLVGKVVLLDHARPHKHQQHPDKYEKFFIFILLKSISFIFIYLRKTSLQGNGGPPKPARRQSLLSVAWTDIDTGVEKIMWREIDKVSRAVFPILFFVFVLLYWPILLMKSS